MAEWNTGLYEDKHSFVWEHGAALLSGRTKIPVLVAPDTTVLIEPTDAELDGTLSRYRRPRTVSRP